MKYQYMTKKEKSVENTHKLHKNLKTYLHVQNGSLRRLGCHWGNAIQHRGSSNSKVFLGCMGTQILSIETKKNALGRKRPTITWSD